MKPFYRKTLTANSFCRRCPWCSCLPRNHVTINPSDMRKTTVWLAATVLACTGALFACSNVKSTDKKEEPIPTQAQLVKRGEYLVNSIGCDDCHSPKRMGAHGPEVIPELRLSGYPASRPVVKPDDKNLQQGYVLLGADLTSAVGPWGISFAANLTPDETGIGAWTEHNFITSIRTGKMKGIENGRPMLPPMPWFNFKNLTDDDLKAMFAYLKSLPAVENRVPAPQPPVAAK